MLHRSLLAKLRRDRGPARKACCLRLVEACARGTALCWNAACCAALPKVPRCERLLCRLRLGRIGERAAAERLLIGRLLRGIAELTARLRFAERLLLGGVVELAATALLG